MTPNILEQKILPKTQRLLTIDFETFYDSDYSLSKLTTSEYVLDQRFEVIGVGVVEGENKQWLTREQFIAFAKTVDWASTCVLMHHAHFDALILKHRFGISPGFIADTLSMANLLGLSAHVGGSLDKLSTHFQVGKKGHEVIDARGKRKHAFSFAQWAAYGEYCVNDCELTLKLFQRMEPMLPLVEMAVIDFTVRCFSESKIVLDANMLKLAYEEEIKRKAEILARTQVSKEDLASNPRFAMILESLGVEPPRKMSKATGSETWAFAKSDPGVQELLEHPNEVIRTLAEARINVKSTIAESRIKRMLALGNPAPIYLKAGAAHTQRWGGGDKTNFQNLPRKGPLRNAIMAGPGKVVVACDSAQIEARGAAWLTGQTDLVQAFSNKRDVYSEFASAIYGRKIDRKKNPDDVIPGFVGKVAILGLGYSMGWAKFALTLLAGAMGGPPVQFTQKEAAAMGVDVEAFKAKHPGRLKRLVSRLPAEDLAVHCAVSAHLVKTYREQNSAIASFWRRGDELISAMAGGIGKKFGPGGVFETGLHCIKRPGGLKLIYPGLKKRFVMRENEETGEIEEKEVFGYLGGRGQIKHVYGGLLLENITQAFCRDIIAEQASLLKWAHGYEIATTTHDEIVTCVEEKEGDAALKTMVEVMRTTPAWCQGLPLNAEGGFAPRYGDCK